MARNAFSVRYGCLARIELICYILVRIVFMSEIIFLPELALSAKIAFSAGIGFSARNGLSDKKYFFLPAMSFWQKLLFNRKCFCQVRTGFLAVFLPNLIKKSYFSKY
jgi:hypothetical protein